jgi:branched-chain amino acid transport system permease protein
MFVQVLQSLISGLTLGAIYALIAFSFSLVFRTTRIMNIAQGEFSMLGGMIAIALIGIALPMFLSVLAAIILVAIIGLIIERLVIRRVRTFPRMMIIMITIGLSMTIQGFAVVLWGQDSYLLPHLSGSDPIPVLGAAILPQTIWILGISAALSILFWFFLDRTMLGLAMRASAENRLAASLVGINPIRVVQLSFVFGASIGALAGVLVAPIVFMNFISGVLLTIKGIVAAIVGGIDSNVGAVVGGLAVGLAESMAAGIFPSMYKDVIALFILLVVLCAMPKGIIRGSAR